MKVEQELPNYVTDLVVLDDSYQLLINFLSPILLLDILMGPHSD